MSDLEGEDMLILQRFTKRPAAASVAGRRERETRPLTAAAECGNGDPKQRGPNCRQRETEEQAKRDGLASVLTNRALTERAARLDTDATRVRAKLAKVPKVQNANPLGAVLEQMIGATAAALTAWQQAIIAGVFEFRAGSLPKTVARPTRPLHGLETGGDPNPADAGRLSNQRPTSTHKPAQPGPGTRQARAEALSAIRAFFGMLEHGPQARASGSALAQAYASLRPVHGWPVLASNIFGKVLYAGCQFASFLHPGASQRACWCLPSTSSCLIGGEPGPSPLVPGISQASLRRTEAAFSAHRSAGQRRCGLSAAYTGISAGLAAASSGARRLCGRCRTSHTHRRGA